MIVLDANILIRAGRRVRQLIDAYAGQGVRFFAPDVAFDDAEKYLPPLLKKPGKPDAYGLHPFRDNSNSCSDITVPPSEEIHSCNATIMQTGVFLLSA